MATRVITPARLPVRTFIGVKRHATVESTGCERCSYLELCRADVVRGDFAWCEDLIPVDLDPAFRTLPRPR